MLNEKYQVDSYALPWLESESDPESILSIMNLLLDVYLSSSYALLLRFSMDRNRKLMRDRILRKVPNTDLKGYLKTETSGFSD
ncbi:hypothetical protein FGO68_gene10513 [Halteria grandinella]|uniref:Uncharacterized protein n=1 Tax=Halteria grandinella TaxID=5974 RepID=A0A8J8NWW1_HALGN|nr:hypothetical protein FGO68_gene10513 [Halteria grandinella]